MEATGTRGCGDDDLFAELGVTAQHADQVERAVLNEVSYRLWPYTPLPQDEDETCVPVPGRLLLVVVLAASPELECRACTSRLPRPTRSAERLAARPVLGTLVRLAYVMRA